MFEVLEGKFLASDESKDPARRSYHDVWAVGLQDLLVLGDGQASEEHSDLKQKIKRRKFQLFIVLNLILVLHCQHQ